MAQRTRTNKNTSLASTGSSGYNKTNKYGSYTGSTTVIRAEKSPLNTQKTDFTAPKKTTITPKKTTTSSGSENYFQKARETQRELTKTLPRINDAPKKDESNFSLSTGSGLKSDTKTSGFSLSDGVAKRYNLPTTTERDFGKGLFGEKEEKNLYNKMVYEIFGPKKTERQLFLEGFEGKEQEIPDDVSYLVPKQDIQSERENNLKLPLDTIPQSRMEAFAKIRNSTPADEARTARNAAVEQNVLPGMENTPVKGTAADRMMETFKRNHLENVERRNKESQMASPWMKRYTQEQIDKMYPNLEADLAKARKEKLDDWSKGLNWASLVPYADIFTNIMQFFVDMERGDGWGMFLDAAGVVPYIGEIGDVGKYIRAAGNALSKTDDVADLAKLSNGIDAISDTAKVADKVDDVYDAAKAVDNAHDTAMGVIRGADGYADSVMLQGKRIDVPYLENNKSRIVQNSPIEVPKNATAKVERKNGYLQIKYEWNDGAYKYQNRWHTKTPGAPTNQDSYWVIERTRPGIGSGKNHRPKVHEVLVGENQWIPYSDWRKAIDAQNSHTITKQQKEILDNGHFQDFTQY